MDCFGGSGVVSLNSPLAGTATYNDLDLTPYRILRTLQRMDHTEALKQITWFYETYDLSKKNEAGFNQLVADWNMAGEYDDHHNLMLLVISKHSFSSLMRFNETGKFNMNFGKRSFGLNNWAKILPHIWMRLQHVELNTGTYQEILRKCRPGDGHVYYFDPPYLASGANVYVNNWTEEDEHKLLRNLDILTEQGGQWVLSNALKIREYTNPILKTWLRERKKELTIKVLHKGEGLYGVHRGSGFDYAGDTLEVIVTNRKRK